MGEKVARICRAQNDNETGGIIPYFSICSLLPVGVKMLKEK